jgi:Outer membrane protein beta-barrel domain
MPEKENLIMVKAACLGVAIFLLAGLASAQGSGGNIFVGYSFENASSSALGLSLSRPNLQGWEGSLEGKWLPWLGIVADFSGHYGSQTFQEFVPAGPPPITVKVTGHELEVMFGPRVSIPVGKFTPFAEVMGGVAHINTGGTLPGPSNTSFATALGGGIDYRLVRLLGWRVEGDYITTRLFNSTQNNLRLSTGIVLRF